MIALKTVRTLDYCVIAVSGASFVLCIGGALYIVPWTQARRAIHAAYDFTLFWKARLLLQMLGAAWALAQWLRLAALWAPDSAIFSAHVTDWSRNGTLCRMYLCISLGLLEPAFLLSALLLCSAALSMEKKQGLWPNAWLLVLAFLAALPVIIAQSLIAWIETVFPKRRWDLDSGMLGHYMLSAYFIGTPQQCSSSGLQGCALCIFPAGACIVSSAFAAMWLPLAWRVLSKMRAAVINRRLKARLRLVWWSAFALVTVGGAFRCATLSGNPFTFQFQVLWFLHLLTIPALLAVVLLMLVILPMHDAYAINEPFLADVDVTSLHQGQQELEMA